MDGANLNAIAGWVDFNALGVDAMHSTLHKTWSILHGGGGPGDAIVAVSEKLVDFLPGYQIVNKSEGFKAVKPRKSIGSFHRHWGNFAHKVRCYTYLIRLGLEGVKSISATAVLAARYVCNELQEQFATLPNKNIQAPRMHEFIISLTEEDFKRLEGCGFNKASIIPSIGKLFLDFGFHSPTVAFPEPLGLMIEPTESYTKKELDRFIEAVFYIKKIIQEYPEILKSAPHFTPIERVDEVFANRHLTLSEDLTELPEIHKDRIPFRDLLEMPIESIYHALIHIND